LIGQDLWIFLIVLKKVSTILKEGSQIGQPIVIIYAIILIKQHEDQLILDSIIITALEEKHREPKREQVEILDKEEKHTIPLTKLSMHQRLQPKSSLKSIFLFYNLR
jgi:hypothetical protein